MDDLTAYIFQHLRYTKFLTKYKLQNIWNLFWIISPFKFVVSNQRKEVNVFQITLVFVLLFCCFFNLLSFFSFCLFRLVIFFRFCWIFYLLSFYTFCLFHFFSRLLYRSNLFVFCLFVCFSRSLCFSFLSIYFSLSLPVYLHFVRSSLFYLCSFI